MMANNLQQTFLGQSKVLFVGFVLWSLLSTVCLPVAEIDATSVVSYQNRNSTKEQISTIKLNNDLISAQTLPFFVTAANQNQTTNRTGLLNFFENVFREFGTSFGRSRGKMRKQIYGHLIPLNIILDNSFRELYGNNSVRAIKATFSKFVAANQILLDGTFVTYEGVAYRGYGYILNKITFDNDRQFKNSESTWDLDDLQNQQSKLQLDSHYNSPNIGLNILFTNKKVIDKRGTEYRGGSYLRSVFESGKNVAFVSTYCSGAVNDNHSVHTMAHELAHSLGACHDEKDSSSTGGDYLMIEHLTRLGSNNLKFSNYSNVTIAYAIHEMDHTRLVDNVKFLCGNLLVEGGEQCDSGGASACCTAECKLQPGAQCSPFNEEHCIDQCLLIERPESEIGGIFDKFYQFVIDNFGIIMIAAVMLILFVVHVVLTISYFKKLIVIKAKQFLSKA